MDDAKFKEIFLTAKVASIEGSVAKNPDWEDADFEAFKVKAKNYVPVLVCKGDTAKEEKMMATVSVPAADAEYLFIIDLYQKVVASKKLSKQGEVLEFEVPESVRGMFACVSTKLEGVWKSQPYIRLTMPATTEYEWEAMMAHEKGACGTAPLKAAQWYPQLDRHPELRADHDGRLPLKVLYLHGHANNEIIARKQMEAFCQFFPNRPTVDYLPGNVQLSTKEHFA